MTHRLQPRPLRRASEAHAAGVGRHNRRVGGREDAHAGITAVVDEGDCGAGRYLKRIT